MNWAFPRIVRFPYPAAGWSGDIYNLLTFQFLRCMSCWPPSPCDRLSRSPRRARHRPRLLRGLRPTHDGPRLRTAESSHLHPDWLPGRNRRSRRMVPTFTRSSIGQGGAQLYSGSIATATPQAFTVASPPLELNGFGVDPPPGCRALHTGPYPPGWSRLRGYGASEHWFACAAPSDLARRARTVWQYQHGSPSRGRLPPITVVPGDRLPRRFIRPLRRPNRDGLSPPLDTPGASWRTARPPKKVAAAFKISWLSEVVGTVRTTVDLFLV